MGQQPKGIISLSRLCLGKVLLFIAAIDMVTLLSTMPLPTSEYSNLFWFFKNTLRNFHTIELLINAGAKLKQTEYHIANELCTLALMNDLDGITAWHVGGANLDSKNYDGRTALHIAVAESNEDIVRYLVSQGCDPKMEDRLGRTPFSEIGETETEKAANLVELLEWGESLKPTSSV